MKVNFARPLTTPIPLLNHRFNLNGEKRYANSSPFTPEMSYLEGISNYNLSFVGRKPVSVYSIDKYGKYEKFDTIAKATETLIERGVKINKRSIAKCAAGELQTTGGLAFIMAEELESTDENGKITINSEKINEIKKRFDKNMAIYALDRKSYHRFESQAEAARQLKLGKDGINNCLSGKLASTGGYTFIWAKDVETTDESGKPVPDKIKLNDFIEKFAGLDRTIYAFDINGDRIMFKNPHQAAIELDIGYTSIANCLNGKQKTAGNYVFAFARNIEKKSKDGRTLIDSKKLHSLLDNFKTNPVYAIRPDGQYVKFKNQKAAAEALGLRRESVSLCVQGAYTQTGGYTFAMASEIETIRKDGQIYVSKKKLNPYLKLFKHKELYAFKKDGTKQRFESPKEASEKLGIELSRISACLLNKRNVTGEYTFAWAKDIEMKNREGETVLRPEALKEVKKKLRDKDVYAISRQDGSYQKFRNARAAAAALDIEYTSVARCLGGRYKSAGGYHFVHSYDIESKDENGKTFVDKRKFLEALRKIQKQAIYIVKSTGEYKRYESAWVAAMEGEGLSFNKGIERYSPRNGFVTIPASEIETLTEDGVCKLDKEKLSKKFEQLRRQAVYLVGENGEGIRFNTRKYARLFSDSLEYDPVKRQYEVKEGCRCVLAEDVETRDKNGLYCFDKTKLNSSKTKGNEITSIPWRPNRTEILDMLEKEEQIVSESYN